MLNRRGRRLGEQGPAAPTGSWMEEPGAFERAGLVGEDASPIDDSSASPLGNPFVPPRPPISVARIGAIVIRAVGALTILAVASGLAFGFGTGQVVDAAVLLGGGVAAVRYGGDRGRAVVRTVCLVGFGLFVAGALLVGAIFALFALVYVLNGGHQLF